MKRYTRIYGSKRASNIEALSGIRPVSAIIEKRPGFAVRVISQKNSIIHC